MNLLIPDHFPFTEKERELIKKKILMFIAWRNSCRPCKVSECPIHCSSPHLNSEDDCLRLLIRWIMEAEIE